MPTLAARSLKRSPPEPARRHFSKTPPPSTSNIRRTAATRASGRPRRRRIEFLPFVLEAYRTPASQCGQSTVAPAPRSASTGTGPWQRGQVMPASSRLKAAASVADPRLGSSRVRLTSGTSVGSSPTARSLQPLSPGSPLPRSGSTRLRRMWGRRVVARPRAPAPRSRSPNLVASGSPRAPYAIRSVHVASTRRISALMRGRRGATTTAS